jgi:hypothetical protein
MGNVLVNENGTGFYSERFNELIFLDGAISVGANPCIRFCVSFASPKLDPLSNFRLSFTLTAAGSRPRMYRACARRQLRAGGGSWWRPQVPSDSPPIHLSRRRSTRAQNISRPPPAHGLSA